MTFYMWKMPSKPVIGLNHSDWVISVVITPYLWYLSCGTFSFSCYLLKTMRTNYIDIVFYSEFYCVTGSLWFSVSRMTHSWSMSDVFVAPMWIHRSRSTCSRSHHLSSLLFAVKAFDDGRHITSPPPPPVFTVSSTALQSSVRPPVWGEDVSIAWKATVATIWCCMCWLYPQREILASKGALVAVTPHPIKLQG